MSGVHAGHWKGSTRQRSFFFKLQKANSRKTLWKVSPQIRPVCKNNGITLVNTVLNQRLQYKKSCKLKESSYPSCAKGSMFKHFEKCLLRQLGWITSSAQMMWRHQTCTGVGSWWLLASICIQASHLFLESICKNNLDSTQQASTICMDLKTDNPIIWTCSIKHSTKRIIVKILHASLHITFRWNINYKRKRHHTVDSHQDSLLSRENGEVLVWTTGADLGWWRNRKKAHYSKENVWTVIT